MADYLLHKFVTAGLRPDLLSTTYIFETNWHVITGAPCSGKTTLINLVAEKGLKVIPEVGRMYVESECARGHTLEELRTSDIEFCQIIRRLQFETEINLHREELLFLDRGIPDSLSYYRMIGLDPNEVLPDCFHHRYASVFVLDRFPVQKDNVRTEDEVEANFLDEWHTRDYHALGYDVIRVPVLPPGERLAFILKKVFG